MEIILQMAPPSKLRCSDIAFEDFQRSVPKSRMVQGNMPASVKNWGKLRKKGGPMDMILVHIAGQQRWQSKAKAKGQPFWIVGHFSESLQMLYLIILIQGGGTTYKFKSCFPIWHNL